MAFSLLGSSPHTRGARPPDRHRRPGERIIPAYAGSTRSLTPPSPAAADHPRIRGEHLVDAGDERGEGGSSPHTRGAPAGRDHRRPAERIIPAYAGSTFHKILPALPKADHPRIRGEHQEGLVGVLGNAGSSPHTRGARLRDLRIDGPGRIIPAYAGSTRVSRSCHSRKRDHPRIRGEHDIVTSTGCRPWGSSPHTRGARRVLGNIGPGDRIIPAYAGSTIDVVSRVHLIPDHPRIRGEHEPSQPAATRIPGSSPHTRGAPRHPLRSLRGSGIIPAYAGSTAADRRRRRPARDHPRIRGEHVAGEGPGEDSSRIIPAYAGSTMEYSERILIRDGSSPHTRGAPVAGDGDGLLTRIIPAYAGSTPDPCGTLCR